MLDDAAIVRLPEYSLMVLDDAPHKSARSKVNADRMAEASMRGAAEVREGQLLHSFESLEFGGVDHSDGKGRKNFVVADLILIASILAMIRSSMAIASAMLALNAGDGRPSQCASVWAAKIAAATAEPGFDPRPQRGSDSF